MLRHTVGSGALMLAIMSLTLMSGEPAVAQRLKAGVLTCDVTAGIGFIVGSTKSVFCNFMPDQSGPPEAYVGSISKFGLDIGATKSGVMVWAVFTGTGGFGPGFLAGDYVGATAVSDRCGWTRRQRPDRRFRPDHCAAAAFGQQSGRPQSGRRRCQSALATRSELIRRLDCLVAAEF